MDVHCTVVVDDDDDVASSGARGIRRRSGAMVAGVRPLANLLNEFSYSSQTIVYTAKDGG